MSEVDFLKAVIATPDDDTIRLIFSDWLEEHGQSERAEFIRVQCENAKFSAKAAGRLFHEQQQRCLGKCFDKCRFCREQKLLSENAVFWGADFPFPVLPENGYCVWRRGFIEEIECTAEDFARVGETLCKMTPLRKVRMTTPPPEIDVTAINDHGTWLNSRFPGVEFEISQYIAVDALQNAVRQIDWDAFFVATKTRINNRRATE
jgi:uncharacterized protein (TIGR02996 family)